MAKLLEPVAKRGETHANFTHPLTANQVMKAVILDDDYQKRRIEAFGDSARANLLEFSSDAKPQALVPRHLTLHGILNSKSGQVLLHDCVALLARTTGKEAKRKVLRSYTTLLQVTRIELKEMLRQTRHFEQAA
jgi:hypothetical protein